MKKAIIFDMDGTLWNSAQGVADSWNEVLKAEGIDKEPLTKEDFYSVMGQTMDKIALKFFPDLSPAGREEIAKKCYSHENDYLREHGGELYPELEETLKTLKEKYSLYIVSNCQSGYIEAFLEHYGFAHYFEDIECYGNNDKPKGENIADIVRRNQIDSAVYVGDIQGDYDASRLAGVGFIHAAYGFGEIEQEVPRIQRFSDLIEVADDVF